MIAEGISYPLEGEGALKRIVIGAVLGFASVLVIPAFLVTGYLLRVLEGAAHGNDQPPAFDEWGEMFVSGLKATLVILAYGILPIGVMMVFVLTIAAGGAAGGGPGQLLAGLGIIGILLSLLVSFLIYYVVPAALTNFAVEGSLGAAFDFGTLKSVLTSADYLIAWVVPFVLAFVVNIVTAVLFATIIGILLVPLVQFYVQVAVFFMFGRAFGNVTGLTDGRDGSSPAGRGEPTQLG